MVPGPPAAVSLALGLAWAFGSFVRFQSWSACAGWNDACRLAAVSGAIAASMLAGFPIMIASGAPRIDLVGKFVFNIIAVCLLIGLDARLQREASPLRYSHADWDRNPESQSRYNPVQHLGADGQGILAMLRGPPPPAQLPDRHFQVARTQGVPRPLQTRELSGAEGTPAQGSGETGTRAATIAAIR